MLNRVKCLGAACIGVNNSRVVVRFSLRDEVLIM